MQTGVKNFLGRRKAGVYVSWLTTHGVITYRNCIFPLKPIPQQPSRTYTGLYGNWKPHILRPHLL
jgi:hypothetical protein